MSIQELAGYLDNYRRGIANLSVSFEENIEFYTAVNFALMNWSQSAVVIPHHRTLWTMITALGALLRSSDYFGSQRALGATFFTLCGFSPRNFNWFNQLGGAGDALLQVSRFLSLVSARVPRCVDNPLARLQRADINPLCLVNNYVYRCRGR